MGPTQNDPYAGWLSIEFLGTERHVELLPVPASIGTERMTTEIVPVLKDFMERIVDGCHHAGSPCKDCRMEVVNGAVAYMQKAAGKR